MPSWVSRLPRKRIVTFSVLLLLLSAAALFAVRVLRSARTALESGVAAASSARSLAARIRPLLPVHSAFEYFLNAASFRSAALFQGDLYVCGRSALFRYSDGVLKRSWQVGRDLPPYPLVSAVVRSGIGASELWIATDGAGIVVYDGKNFRQILPELAAARKISALLPLPTGQVIVGTSAAGLYVSDGKSLRTFHAEFAKAQITALAGDEDQLWIGTRDDGAWRWSGGEAVHFTADLPDLQVLSIAVRGRKAWVGTPLGVAEFSGDKLERHLAGGVFAQALAERDGSLWIGTVDQGTLALAFSVRTPRPQSASLATDIQPINSFAQFQNGLLAVGPDRISDPSSGQLLITAQETSLASDHVTAVHEDARGHLWIGYFDHGLDLIAPNAPAKPAHFEDDVLFCINRIKENPRNGTVAVATANGLVLFDATGTPRQTLDRESGLIASHVTDVLFRNDPSGTSAVIATPAGLSFLAPDGISSLYAFQGLVNNHVYTLAQAGKTLYAGTLGGLSILRTGLVQANFTTANSELRQNWITASAVFDGKLYLGTYGSGVVRFDDSGSVASFPAFARRRIEINPNAMLATARALYAGTAGQGLAILCQGDDRWQFITAGLPSTNITALDAQGGRLYIGTENGLVRISEKNLLP